MKSKKTTSLDSAPSVILIEWPDGRIFGQWCLRCREVTEFRPYGEWLRCVGCNHVGAKLMDALYVKHLREEHTIQ